MAQFSIEKEEELKAQAHKLAIDEAKAKAGACPRPRCTSSSIVFSESGIISMMYAYKEAMMDRVAHLLPPRTSDRRK